LHVGDNVHSDIQLAAAEGFDTFYVPHWRDSLLAMSGLSKSTLRLNHLNAAFSFTMTPVLIVEDEEEETEED
jgi:FMN phosphatase YigB (HAD superfamily)